VNDIVVVGPVPTAFTAATDNDIVVELPISAEENPEYLNFACAVEYEVWVFVTVVGVPFTVIM
jgi:hypothetical protein